MAESDQQSLLQAAKNGDHAAFGLLLEQFRPYVRHIARATFDARGTGRLDESDIIQDVMVLAQQAFSKFQGETVGEFVGWLRTLAKRGARQSWRAHASTGKRSIHREQVLEEMDSIARSSEPPEAELRRHESAARVAAAVDRLPAEMREVVLARVQEGSSYLELAARLGKSEGSLRVLYTRALRKLAAELPGE